MVQRTLLILGTALVACLPRIHAAAGDENWQEGFVLPPGVDGEVRAMATIGRDLFVGGNFESANGVLVRSIARWDGTNWFPLGSGVNGTVYALAVEGTNLYVGGRFDRAGSVPAINLARWNGSEWQQIGDITGFDDYSFVAPSFGAQGPKVMTLLTATNHLIVGGNFRSAGGVAATNIAVFDGTTWSTFGSGLGNLGGQIHTVAHYRGQLYAGGIFINSGECYLTNVARWSGTNWHAVGAGLVGPALDYWLSETPFRGVVNVLAVQGTRLIAGGQINQSGRARLVNLTRLSGKKWRPVPRGVGTTGLFDSVEHISVRGKEAFITGNFQRAGTVGSPNIVRWNGRSWFNMGGGLGGPAKALAFVGSDVYVGGLFGLAGDVSAAYVACWNDTSNRWRALGEGVGNTLIENAVTLATSGDTVFAAGPIHTAGTNRAHNVAAWTGTNWLVLKPGLTGVPVASAVSGSNYYVGGRFYIESIRATNIACWNGSNWFALPPLLDAEGQPAIVFAMAGGSNQLFVAGNFVSAGDVAATNVALWTGTAWSSVGDAPIVTPLIGALPMISDGQHLYVLNTTTNNSGASDEKIHRWDGENWTLLGAPNGAGHIRSLAFFGAYLYVASVFDQEGSTDTTKLDRWTGNKWEAVNWPFGQLGHVPLLAATESYLYAGGPWDFTASSSPGIARFDGANWTGLGSGLIDTDGFGNVITIATSARRVIVAGFFKTAGGKPSYRFAIWNEP